MFVEHIEKILLRVYGIFTDIEDLSEGNTALEIKEVREVNCTTRTYRIVRVPEEESDE